MYRAFRFRIYPSKEQEILLAKTFGCCRFLYNIMLADKISEYKASGKMLKNTPAMYKKEYPFLKEVDSLALANVQLHLETAYKNFFRTPTVGFPKFKSKHRNHNSYTTNVVNGNISILAGKLKLPKLKEVRVKQHREIPDNYVLKSVIVSREPSGKYYASLLYEIESSENQAKFISYQDARILGIDYAMHGMTVFSDNLEAVYEGSVKNKYFSHRANCFTPLYGGAQLARPGFRKRNGGNMRKAGEKLAREQRRLSHCQRGSNNYQKQKRRVAQCHEKVKNQRKDYIHKLTRRIAEEYDAVGVEDIDMKAMSRCLNFGKSVMDNSYGMFRDILDYKLKEKNKEFVKIDRFFPSSKKCCKCGEVKKELKLSERVYRCSCGNVMDRDKNAAVNIREEARRMLTE